MPLKILQSSSKTLNVPADVLKGVLDEAARLGMTRKNRVTHKPTQEFTKTAILMWRFALANRDAFRQWIGNQQEDAKSA